MASKRKNEIVKENIKIMKDATFLNDAIPKLFDFFKIELLQIYDTLLGEIVYKNEKIDDDFLLNSDEIQNHYVFNKSNISEFQFVSDENNQLIYIFSKDCVSILKKAKGLLLFQNEINYFLETWCYLFRKQKFEEKNKFFISEMLKCKKIEEILILLLTFLKTNHNDYQLFIYDIKKMKIILDKKYDKQNTKVQHEIFSMKFENEYLIFKIDIILASVFDLDINFVKKEMESIVSKKLN